MDEAPEPAPEMFPFEVISHLVPVAPFREYPQAIIDDAEGVYISVKQYRPLLNNHSEECLGNSDPITIIAAPGLGFIKELYEPLFADLLHQARLSGVSVRSIWCADASNIGESAAANRHNLGCDPSWFDHARDLWSILDRFQDQMRRPFVGLGHSYGCNQLLFLSAWHPTLFHSLIFVEPGIDRQYGRGIAIPWALRVLRGKTAWNMREEAEEAVIQACEAAGWDRRVQERLRKYGVHPAARGSSSVWESAFPKHQIAALTGRFDPRLVDGGDEGEEAAPLSDYAQGDYHAGGFYRHELQASWDMVPFLQPPVLYIGGGASPAFGHPPTREARARITGTGPGGNGGVARGAVKQVVIGGAGHDLVFDGEHIAKVASHATDWLVAESRRWAEGPKKRREAWLRKSLEEKQSVTNDFVAGLKAEMVRRRRAAGAKL